MTIQPPPIGSVFGNFYVCERFQHFWQEVRARVPYRHSKRGMVHDASVLDDALWLTQGNVPAAARITGYSHVTIWRHRDGKITSRRARSMRVTPEMCREALKKHGNWEAARTALELSKTTFATRMRQIRERQLSE